VSGADRIGARGTFPPHWLAELKARVGLAGLVGSYVALRRNGRELVGLCPFHGEKSPSFTVNEGKGFFHCFGCGAHGDAIGFVMAVDGMSFVDAVKDLARDAGLPLPDGSIANGVRRKRVVVPPAPPGEPEDDAARHAWLLGVWKAARPAAGTVVEVYLRRRGITAAIPPTLRFVPALRHPDGGTFPAMVAAVQGPDRGVAGLHRTYLTADGRDRLRDRRAKLMAGRCWGGAIRLAPAGPCLGLSEGIETGLSVASVVPELPVWAAGSLGNVAGAGLGQGEPHPDKIGARVPSAAPDMDRPGIVLPPTVREVVIIADSDGDPHVGRALIARAASRFRRQRLSVRIVRPPPGMDANDLLRAAAPGDSRSDRTAA